MASETRAHPCCRLAVLLAAWIPGLCCCACGVIRVWRRMERCRVRIAPRARAGDLSRGVPSHSCSPRVRSLHMHTPNPRSSGTAAPAHAHARTATRAHAQCPRSYRPARIHEYTTTSPWLVAPPPLRRPRRRRPPRMAAAAAAAVCAAPPPQLRWAPLCLPARAAPGCAPPRQLRAKRQRGAGALQLRRAGPPAASWRWPGARATRRRTAGGSGSRTPTPCAAPPAYGKHMGAEARERRSSRQPARGAGTRAAHHKRPQVLANTDL